MADRPGPAELSSPVIAVIGEVCDYRERLGWFERRPLFGRTILVPRPEEQVEATVGRLEQLGARVIVEPVLRIESEERMSLVDAAIGRLDAFDVPGLKRLTKRTSDLSRQGLFRVTCALNERSKGGQAVVVAVIPNANAAFGFFWSRVSLTT